MLNAPSQFSLLNQLPPAPKGKKGWPWTEESPVLPPLMPDGREWPKISIVTPSFNQGRFIEETIRSVLLQNYPNLEYIVIDGGSDDDSEEIIKKYEPWLTYWVSEKDEGQSDAINKGMKLTTGMIAGWLNSDDIFLAGALRTFSFMSAEFRHSVAWVGSCNIVDDQGNFIRNVVPYIEQGSPEDIGAWYIKAHFYQPACLFNRSKFLEIGLLNEKLHFVLDVDLWIRFAQIGTFHLFDSVVAEAKHYPDIKTLRNIPVREMEHIYINLKYGLLDSAQLRFEKNMDSLCRNHILAMNWKLFFLLSATKIYRALKSTLQSMF